MKKSKELGILIYMTLWTLANLAMLIYGIMEFKDENSNTRKYRLAIGFASTNAFLGIMFLVCFKLANLSASEKAGGNDPCYFMLAWMFGIFLGLASVLCFSFGCDYAKDPEGIFMMVISMLMLISAIVFLCTLD